MKNNHYVLIKAPWGNIATNEVTVKGALWEETKDLINAQYLEAIPLGESYKNTQFVMLIDECGKMYDPPRPINLMATALYQLQYNTEDVIVGDVVIALRDGEEIEPLSRAVAGAFVGFLQALETGAREKVKEEPDEGPKMAF